MAQTELKRQIGLFSAVMLIAGDMIGTGIFISTGAIAETLPTPGGVLLVWLFGGLLALAGALTCAELAAALPYAGGDYIYIREAYGKLMGFLSGWSSFLVTFSGAIAFLSVILNGFMSFFFPVLGSEDVIFSLSLPLIPITVKIGTLFSMGIVLLLSGLHCLGVRQGTLTQNILTILKIGALLGIIVLGIFFGNGNTSHFEPLFDWEKIGNSSLFGAAFIPVIFAYSGWNAVTYIAGEVKDPEKNLPRALMYGVLIVIALYLAINAVYIYAVPVTEMKGALRMSEVATTALFGYKTSAWITAIITVSILGALNVVTMIGPRIYYAMAKDGVFFQQPNLHSPEFRHANQGDFAAGVVELLADSHQHVGRIVHLCQRRDHAVFGFHGGLGDRASFQAAGTQTALSALGLSGRADTFCPGSSVDRLGLGDGETQRVADRTLHR